jgi:hypothetical protein
MIMTIHHLTIYLINSNKNILIFGDFLYKKLYELFLSIDIYQKNNIK